MSRSGPTRQASPTVHHRGTRTRPHAGAVRAVALLVALGVLAPAALGLGAVDVRAPSSVALLDESALAPLTQERLRLARGILDAEARAEGGDASREALALLRASVLVDEALARLLAAVPGPLDASGGPSLARSVRLAQATTTAQAVALGLVLPDDAPQAGTHALPSEAALALLARHAIQPTEGQLADLAALDEAEPRVREALARLLDAFVAYEEAGRRVDAIAFASLSAPPEDEDARRQRGMLADVFAARSGLLDAALGLHEALAAAPPPALPGGLCPRVSVPPAFTLSLGTCDDVHADNVALLVDLGGHDTYLNNAGGSNVVGGCTSLPGIQFTGDSPHPGVAALFDLAGDDKYVSRASCGVNGGGSEGVGLLFDASGRDVYGHEAGPAPDWAAGFLLAAAEAGAPAGAALAAPAGPAAPLARLPAPPRAEDAPARLLVGFHGEPPAAATTFLGASVVHADPTLRFVAVEAPDARAFRLAAGLDPRVAYVEEDAPVWSESLPDDPLLPEQYGIQTLRVPEAWAALGATPADVTICFPDTGLRRTHEDLDPARYAGGHDFLDGDDDPTDADGHGTHLVGIAAATTGNALGVAGVAPARILAARINGGPEDDGQTSHLASAIRWCADEGADVISLSVGSFDTRTLHDAVRHAWSRGVLLIDAVGNTGCGDSERGGCISPPAAYPEVVGVGCVDGTGRMCRYASFGTSGYGSGVELVAPGDLVLSLGHANDASYARMSGTSMSAPHVSGVAALVWSARPDLSNEQVRGILRESARDLGLAGCDGHYGYGLVDAARAVEAALSGVLPGPVEGTFHCTGHFDGVNGGASSHHVRTGVGFLYDGGGDGDVFAGGTYGVNGGGSGGGIGALVDEGGNDVYAAGASGTNGGALNGAGLLFDLGGDDRYLAEGKGVNGGADVGGRALLVDLDGSDLYGGSDSAINGGSGLGRAAPAPGVAALVDLGRGDDAYVASGRTTNGAGNARTSLLFDGGGSDVYAGGTLVVNGGSGFLLDLGAGDDRYLAGDGCVNGACGFLYDGGGDDHYRAGSWWANGGGGGITPIPGFLLDAGGDDRYLAGDRGTNGGAYGLSQGFLMDLSGDDVYVAGSQGTNGGGLGEGAGHLVDLEGDDAYLAGAEGTNGGAVQRARGLLLDGDGDDSYQDPKHPQGACRDCSTLTRDETFAVGLQVDVPSAPLRTRAGAGPQR